MLRSSFFVLATLISMQAMAAPGERGDRPDPPHVVIAQNADALGIDEATLFDIQETVDAARPAMEALHETARANRGDEASREALHTARRELMQDIMFLLTPEQQDAVRDLLPRPPRGGERGERSGARSE